MLLSTTVPSYQVFLNVIKFLGAGRVNFVHGKSSFCTRKELTLYTSLLVKLKKTTEA